MENKDNPIIGYSAFIFFEECYEYNENACYIADSPESLKECLEGASFNIKDYRIDTIKLNDILDDYGCSCGEFAMEPEALKRFKRVEGLTYTVEPYDNPFNYGEPDLFVVNIDKKNDSEVDKEYTITEILESFRIFDGVYKREQIDAAVNFKKEITPHLIKILETVLADPEKYASDENLNDHMYAVMLLGHFKEFASHKVIVDLFSLPDDLPDKLFGDITTSNLPVILLNTCGVSIELIKSLILNKEADDFCRISACEALAYAVVEGYVSREDVVTFFGTLFTGQETDEVSDFWGLMAIIVCNLYPEEIIEIIKQAYDDELIMPGMIPYSEFEDALKLGKNKCLERLKIDLERHSLDDIHGSMSWWACFNPNIGPDSPQPAAEQGPELGLGFKPLLEESKFFSSSTDLKGDFYPSDNEQTSSKSQKNKKKAKKKKRKQAKASKKKNRR